jgi:hypothetical protein
MAGANAYKMPDAIRALGADLVERLNGIADALATAITTDDAIDAGAITEQIIELRDIPTALTDAVTADEMIHDAAVDKINEQNASLVKALQNVQVSIDDNKDGDEKPLSDEERAAAALDVFDSINNMY